MGNTNARSRGWGGARAPLGTMPPLPPGDEEQQGGEIPDFAPEFTMPLFGKMGHASSAGQVERRGRVPVSEGGIVRMGKRVEHEIIFDCESPALVDPSATLAGGTRLRDPSKGDRPVFQKDSQGRTTVVKGHISHLPGEVFRGTAREYFEQQMRAEEAEVRAAERAQRAAEEAQRAAAKRASKIAAQDELAALARASPAKLRPPVEPGTPTAALVGLWAQCGCYPFSWGHALCAFCY